MKRKITSWKTSCKNLYQIRSFCWNVPFVLQSIWSAPCACQRWTRSAPPAGPATWTPSSGSQRKLGGSCRHFSSSLSSFDVTWSYHNNTQATIDFIFLWYFIFREQLYILVTHPERECFPLKRFIELCGFRSDSVLHCNFYCVLCR